MRTTISLPDHVLAQAKRRAAEEKVTLGEFIAAAVRERVLRGRSAKKNQPFSIVTFGERGLAPGQSLNQWRAAFDNDEAGRLQSKAIASASE
jgi:hypothetical protein